MSPVRLSLHELYKSLSDGRYSTPNHPDIPFRKLLALGQMRYPNRSLSLGSMGLKPFLTCIPTLLYEGMGLQSISIIQFLIRTGVLCDENLAY